MRALLAKAESTPFESEAAACTAKAQELMARYAIDEAVLRAGAAPSGTPSSMRVIVASPYARPKVVLLSVVARNNRCRSVWDGDYGFSTVFGAPGDLWAVDLLYTSLLVQAVVAVQREQQRSRSFRHAFLLAFAHRIGERQREVTTAVTVAATVASGDAFLPVLAARERRSSRGTRCRLSTPSTSAGVDVKRVRSLRRPLGCQHGLDRPRRSNRRPIEVYRWCMARTNIDIDEDAAQAVMRRYHLRTKRDAVNFALRAIAGEALEVEAARELRGSGWDGDLDELRASRRP